MARREVRPSLLKYIAVLEAITTIHDVKDKELVGTVFTAIPLGDREERENHDHITFVTKEPQLAATYLDKCAMLFDVFYSLHRKMVHELENLLDDHETLRRNMSVLEN